MLLEAVYPVGVTKVRFCFTRRIAYNSLNVDQIIPNLILVFAFRPPIHVPDWSKHTWVTAIFAKCAKKNKNQKNLESLIACISKEFSSNLECGLPWVEETSIVNLVLFRSDITELQMRENCDFVVPINILTPIACAPFSWVARHTTMCFDYKNKWHLLKNSLAVK